MSILQRASVFAIKEESTVGVLTAPTTGADFIPLRAGFSQTATVDQLESDELLNDIGASKSLIGLERPEGSHPAYLKNSEVQGTPPETALLYKSAFGGQVTPANERDTVAGSTAGTATTRAVLNVDTGEGVEFPVGRAVLIKDLTNGYSIRNVNSVTGDALSLNFNLDVAPASGVNLGRPTTFTPQASGLPSFSAWGYGGNGGYVQAIAGCKTSEISMNLPTGEQAEVQFSYEGTSIYFNPVVVTATTKFIDFEDDGGVKAITLDEGIFKSPIAFAEHVQNKFLGTSVDVITVSYNSQTGKYTIASDGTTFELLWSSGTNAANSARTKLGFNAVDKTAATSYVSDNEADWSSPITPVYDNATNIVVKGAQLFVGTFSDNICRGFNEATINISLEQEDILSACAESGLSEKLPVSRVATLEATLVLEKHEAALFDKFINSKDIEVMLNAGAKDSSSNWVAGKCINVYMPQATLSQHDVAGDTVVELTITARGFLSGAKKDIYLNFI
jgi:hypothetical protein